MKLKIGQYRKLVAYVGGVALTYLTQRYSGDPSATSWLPALVALGGAYGVYASPNDSPMLQIMGEFEHTAQPPAAPVVPTTVPQAQPTQTQNVNPHTVTVASGLGGQGGSSETAVPSTGTTHPGSSTAATEKMP